VPKVVTPPDFLLVTPLSPLLLVRSNSVKLEVIGLDGAYRDWQRSGESALLFGSHPWCDGVLPGCAPVQAIVVSRADAMLCLQVSDKGLTLVNGAKVDPNGTELPSSFELSLNGHRFSISYAKPTGTGSIPLTAADTGCTSGPRTARIRKSRRRQKDSTLQLVDSQTNTARVNTGNSNLYNAVISEELRERHERGERKPQSIPRHLAQPVIEMAVTLARACGCSDGVVVAQHVARFVNVESHERPGIWDECERLMKVNPIQFDRVALNQCDHAERSMIGSFLRSLVRKLKVPQGQKQVADTLGTLLGLLATPELNAPDNRIPDGWTVEQ